MAPMRRIAAIRWRGLEGPAPSARSTVGRVQEAVGPAWRGAGLFEDGDILAGECDGAPIPLTRQRDVNVIKFVFGIEPFGVNNDIADAEIAQQGDTFRTGESLENGPHLRILRGREGAIERSDVGSSACQRVV